MYEFTVKEAQDIDIARIVAENKAADVLVVTSGQNKIILASGRFLKQFAYPDCQYLGSCTLAPTMGYSQYGEFCQDSPNSANLSMTYGKNLPDGWRWQLTTLTMEEITTQVSKARAFKRRITVSVTAL